MRLEERIHHYQILMNDHLLDYFNTHLKTSPPSLRSAIEYSSLNGGKRIRAILMYGVGELFNIPSVHLKNPAAAIELIHTYSLIHDDLPAMDNSPLRRGKPTTHKAFNEAIAILTGDALQPMAFELLCKTPYASNEQKIKMIMELASASGASGMVAGQIIDIESDKNNLSSTSLETLHQLKTGQLIEASMMLAGIMASIDDKTEQHLRELAQHIGLAFQIQDDILDNAGNSIEMGKMPTDTVNEKITYVSLYGLHEAKQKLSFEIEQAHKKLNCINKNEHWLHALIDYIQTRKK
jgi:geranylgeranyl pyrophosphate synthase